MSKSPCIGDRWGGCGQTFSDTAAFDRHRTGDFAGIGGHSTRRCMTEAEMLAHGLVQHPDKQDQKGRPIWILEVSLQRKDRLRPFVAKRHSSEGQLLAS
jgi:hypothetical protein